MKAALIVPDKARTNFPKWKSLIAFPPLTMQVVAAQFPDDVEVHLYNESVQPVPVEGNFDLVGISINTATAKRGYDIAGSFKKRGIPVVLGGVHASVLPNEALEHGDAVIVGEAEGAFQDFFEDFKNGRIKQIYKNSSRFRFSDYRLPRRDLHKKTSFVEASAVEASRGCGNNCGFCTHLPYTPRRLEDTLKEIENLPGKFFTFIDLNIGQNTRSARQLFDAIAPLRKKWFGETQQSSLLDEEYLSHAKRAGCIGLFVGYESINSNAVNEAGKGINNPDDYKRGVNLAHKYGILVKGSFIHGFDCDTKADFARTSRMAVNMNLDAAVFNVLVPYPGTRIFESMKLEGRLLYTNFPEDWSMYERRKAVFRPRNMTAEELQEGVLSCWKDFYSARSIAKRIGQSLLQFDKRTLIVASQNIPAYLAFK
jgi:radical SAM superfamily enzyme YgiQ (UPF0313 family)